MKKILCLVLAAMMCISMLAGCNNTGNTDDTTGNTDTNVESSDSTGEEENAKTLEPVQITDAYTFNDPTDYEYDTRYVLYMGPESSLVAPSVEKGQLYQYTIIYAKEDVAMGEYNLYVCDSKESAQNIKAEMENFGMVADILEEDNTIIRIFNDQYTLDASISIYVMAEMMEEASASAYVDIYLNMYGATLKE